MQEGNPYAKYELRKLLIIFRGRADLSRAKLAELLDVSDRAIQHWETGANTPTPIHLQKLVQVYLQKGGVFTRGQERQEMELLWEKARYEDVPLDPAVWSQLDEEKRSVMPGRSIVPIQLSPREEKGPERVFRPVLSVFHFNEPLTDSREFYGRQQIRQKALDHIFRGASISLVGPRRIGKTWFLWYMQLVASQELGAAFEMAYLDATLPGCATVTGFTQMALEALGVSQAISMENSFTLVHLEQIVKQLRGQDRIPVLCIDEFEGLCTQAFDYNFFSGLRAIAQMGLVLITASKDALVNLVSAHISTSPFFNMLIPVSLGAFTRLEAEAFVRAKGDAAGFTTQEQDYILHYGRTDERSWPPARLQLVGMLLFEDKHTKTDGAPEHYQPDNPHYWQQFAHRVEALYRKVVP